DGDDRVFAHRGRVAPALQAARDGRHVVGIRDALARRAARFGEADEEIGVAVAADFFLVHVVQQEVLRILELVGHARVDVAEVVGERPDVVVMVLRPAGEVIARELAARPRDAERRLGGGAAFDGVFEGGAEFVRVHERRHAASSGGWAVDLLYTIY